jgi:uroporphyrinogen decarboxylase
VAGLLIGYDNFMRHMYRKPELAHHLMDVATETIIRYLRAYERACGKIHQFMIADDSLAFMSSRHFVQFSLPYLQRIFAEFKTNENIGILHCDTNSTHLLDVITDVGMDVFNFGPEMDVVQVKKAIGDRVCLLGNIDPLHVVLPESPEVVEKEAKRIIEAAKPGGGFIMTMGSGTARGTSSENIDAIKRAVELYGRYDR